MVFDYKIRIEGQQSGKPVAINLFSIDGRIRSVKGICLDSILNLHLEFDEKDELLLRASGQQFDCQTDLRFRYDDERRIHKVKGIRHGRNVNLTAVRDNRYFSFFTDFQNRHFGAIFLSGQELKRIFNISEKYSFEFNWKNRRIVERSDYTKNEILDLSYEQIFTSPKTIYRTSQLELSADVEVDNQTLINYFLFLH